MFSDYLLIQKIIGKFILHEESNSEVNELAHLILCLYNFSGD